MNQSALFHFFSMKTRTEVVLFAPAFLLLILGWYSHAASAYHGLDDVILQSYSRGVSIHQHDLNALPWFPSDDFCFRNGWNMNYKALHNMTCIGNGLRCTIVSLPHSSMERVLFWSYDTASRVYESPSLPLCDDVDESSTMQSMNESSLKQTNMSALENQWMTPSVAEIKQEITTDTVPFDRIAKRSLPIPNTDMNHTPFLREATRNGTARRRKKPRAKVRPSAISMETASKMHTTLPVLRTFLRHMVAFVQQQIPQVIVVLKLVTNVLFILLRSVYSAMTTVFIPFAKKEWRKYHPLIVLFCIQQQHALIKHCTFLYIMVTKVVDQWQRGKIPEASGWMVATATKSEMDRPMEEPVLPYYLQAVVTDTPEWIPNISVATPILLWNRSVATDPRESTRPAESSSNAVVESVTTPVADWNDTITALVIRLSLIVIMCVLIAISQ
jgi:hypothetical protein